MVDAAHHLATRAVIFRDADRVTEAVLAEAEKARTRRGNAGRCPGARGVVIAGRAVKRESTAVGDFVGDGQRRDELAT